MKGIIRNMESNRKNKRNQTFQYLEALIILMVIDDHVSTRIGILSSIFPYNSFYMPFLVFISGYFYNKKSIGDYLIHKGKRLLIPYFLWNILGNSIAYILMSKGIVSWYGRINLQSLMYCFVNGPLSSINGPSWFVIMLFQVSVLYNMIRNVFKKEKLSMDISLLIGCALIGCASLIFCMQGYNRGIKLPILRGAFYLQFYHLGYFFRRYLEEYLQRLNKMKVCFGCICFNLILIFIYGDKINFYSTSAMGSFNSWYLPLVTSIIGMTFWYEVMSYLSEKIGQSRYIDFIAENTFTIMETHLLFANIPNFYVLFRIKNGSSNFPDFDIQKFVESAWFRYNGNARLAGFFCGVCGSLLTVYLMKLVKEYFVHMRRQSHMAGMG